MGTFAFSKVWNIGDGEIDELLENGYDLCITTGHEGENLYTAEFGRKTVLAIGSEAHGVSERILAHSERVVIPTEGVESLNAAAAAAVLLYEAARRRGASQ